MSQKTRNQLLYENPIVQIMKEPNFPLVGSQQHQRKHYSDELGSCVKAETKSLELEDFPIQGYFEEWPRVQMNGNLEASIHEAA